MRSLLVRYVPVFLVGLLGMFAGLAVIHSWTDHQALHQIIRLINENAAKANAQPQSR